MEKEGIGRKDRSIFQNNVLFYVCFAVNSIFMLVLFFLITNNMKIYRESTAELEDDIRRKLDYQTEYIIETSHSIVSSAVSSASEIILSEIETGTQTTGSRINRINTVYSNLLAEMEKRTLDSIYTEVTLLDMEKEASVHFTQGRYAQAGALFTTVANAQPENKEARFYYLYSLFLNNRMNRGNYQQIKEGFLTLEKGGYYRAEIKEVLSFIESEERMVGMESSR